jgi:hypothetical protein
MVLPRAQPGPNESNKKTAINRVNMAERQAGVVSGSGLHWPLAARSYPILEVNWTGLICAARPICRHIFDMR